MGKSKLKSCPFCGGEVNIAEYDDLCFRSYYSITRGIDPNTRCKCRVFMESEFVEEGDEKALQKAKDELIERWNTRVKVEA